jgi:hypothetical protein
MLDYAPLNHHPDDHVRAGGCLDGSCRLLGSYELDCYRRVGFWCERHVEELREDCLTLGGWRCSIHRESEMEGVLGNPLAAARIGIQNLQWFRPYRAVLGVQAPTSCNALG